MREALTGQDILAELVLVRASFKGALLLLEGGSDCAVFDRHIDTQDCQTIPTGGKTQLIEALKGAQRIGIPGVLGVVDADYWHIDGQIPNVEDLIVLPVHDLEIQLLESPALDDVIRAFGSARKVNEFLEINGFDSVRQALYARAGYVASLRRLSHLEGLNLRFDGVQLSAHIDRRTLAVDARGVTERVLQNTANPQLNLEIVAAGAATYHPEPHQWTQLCNGHDAMEILSVGLRRALGSCDARTASLKNVERLVRLAFDSRHFATTPLQAAIRDWEHRHADYHVLP